MPHVPPTGRGRASHKFRVRATHDFDASFFMPNAGAAADAEQWTYDQVLPPGSIRPGMSVTDLINGPATVVIDASGITIEDGALTLKDEFGSTVLVSSGFQGSWADFVSTGVYNGVLRSGVLGVLVNGRSAQLPYFTVSRTGSAVLTFQADATMPGGNRARITFSAVTVDVGVLVTDLISVIGGHSYRASVTGAARGGAGTAGWNVTLYVNWYDAAGALISSTALAGGSNGGTTNKTFGPDADVFDQASGDAIVSAPLTAAFASIEVQANETGVHHASTSVDIGSLSLITVPMGKKTTEDMTFGDVVVNNLGAGGYVNALGGIYAASNVFPSPTLNLNFFRSDLKMWFFYDGTRWLSSNLYLLPIQDRVGSMDSTGVAATTVSVLREAIGDLQGGSDIWLVNVQHGFFVNGGTALDAANKWAVVLEKVDSAAARTTIDTLTISSGTSSVFRSNTQTLGALLGTTSFRYSVSLTKTGTPGPLLLRSTLAYRIVAT